MIETVLIACNFYLLNEILSRSFFYIVDSTESKSLKTFLGQTNRLSHRHGRENIFHVFKFYCLVWLSMEIRSFIVIYFVFEAHQNNIKIMTVKYLHMAYRDSKNKELFTYGLTTCTALEHIMLLKKNFLPRSSIHYIIINCWPQPLYHYVAWMRESMMDIYTVLRMAIY